MLNRVSKTKTLLKKQTLDAALISDVYDIFYLTGFSNFAVEECEAFLLISKKGNFVFTDGRHAEAVRTQVPHFTLIERTANNPLDKILKTLAKKLHIKKLGFDENNITFAEHRLVSACFNDLNHFSISDLRMIKDSNEMSSIKTACQIGDKAFRYIQTKIKRGITEKQLAFELEIFIKQQGADLSFPSIVAFGSNASIPHHQTGNSKLVKNSFVLLDFGVKHDNYCSDMTRTIFFGKPNEKQRKMYQTVLEAQRKAIDFFDKVRPSLRSDLTKREIRIKASDIDKAARDYIISQGFPSIPHSLGHGIGVEVHEAPSLSSRSKQTLENGMVFSIEPGIYIPGFGGVRIEDLFTIQNKKLVQLTNAPKTSLLTLSN